VINITPAETAGLADEFPWFSKLGTPLPTVIAILDSPQSDALHFLGIGKKLKTSLPQGARILISEDAEAPDGITVVRVPDPKANIGDILHWLRNDRSDRVQFENRNGSHVAANASIPLSCRIEPGAVVWPGVVVKAR
jgi:UDP-3-O-[3-hydroxymyristoyl] glucosamine N-acyltransferase